MKYRFSIQIIISIILIKLFSINSFSQNNEENIKLIYDNVVKEILKDEKNNKNILIADSSWQSILWKNLCSVGDTTYFKTNKEQHEFFQKYIKQNKKKIDLTNYFKDFNNVRIINKDSLKKLLSSTKPQDYYQPKDSIWSKINKIVPKGSCYYDVSQISFHSKYYFAAVCYQKTCFRLMNQGYIIFLVKVNNSWVIKCKQPLYVN